SQHAATVGGQGLIVPQLRQLAFPEHLFDQDLRVGVAVGSSVEQDLPAVVQLVKKQLQQADVVPRGVGSILFGIEFTYVKHSNEVKVGDGTRGKRIDITEEDFVIVGEFWPVNNQVDVGAMFLFGCGHTEYVVEEPQIEAIDADAMMIAGAEVEDRSIPQSIQAAILHKMDIARTYELI